MVVVVLSLFGYLFLFVNSVDMWIKDLRMGIKKCRVTSDKKNVGLAPNKGGRALHYGYHINHIPCGQGKFTV